MLDNKFFLTSVAKFLRRGRVDRGTGGGKVVVVVDSSKRKVSQAYTTSAVKRSTCQLQRMSNFIGSTRLCHLSTKSIARSEQTSTRLLRQSI